MASVVELRSLCDQTRDQRREDVTKVLTDWLEENFILGHRPWRAMVDGDKRCRPIPMHRNFCSREGRRVYAKKTDSEYYFFWPELPDNEIREVIEGLGFVISEHVISLAVPVYKEGKPMTFAQQWVRKINNSYSKHIASEKKLARQLYNDVLAALCAVAPEDIETGDGYTLFTGLKFDRTISGRCHSFLTSLLKKDGITELFENGKYKGFRVSQQPI